MPNENRTGSGELVQAALAARRFYVDGHTQLDIGREMGLSRFKVARLIEIARREGIVRIEIVAPGGVDAELSTRLRDAYGLRRAMVVPAVESGADEQLREQLGEVAAELLRDLTGPDDVLGLAAGRTLNAMARKLTDLRCREIVQLTGMAGSLQENSLEVIRRASEVSGRPAVSIYAPLVLPDATTAASLRRDPGVQAAFRRFGDVSVAVVAVGSFDPPDSQMADALAEHDRRELGRLGARAEVCAIPFDAGGRPVPGFAERVLGIGVDQLTGVGEVLAVAGGARKSRAIRAALGTGLVTSLVTDSGTARQLLDAAEAAG
ncbi:sugar-binding transcriptional regulator [Pseudonocardia alni]|uniref:sugar-binding transcriptional regulator n=1 Tax=Pseudonocardia alni TaxID=33907 RepID=UPI0033CC4F6E